MGGARDDRLAAAVAGADRAASTSCSVRVLGAVDVDCGRGLIDLGGPKQVALLVVLALHVNEIVPTDRVIELLWGDRAPRTAAHSVQIYVSGLRRTFTNLPSPPVIVTHAPGYRLEIDAEAVDAHRFAQLVAVGLDEAGRGDAPSAVATLRAALSLWRGEPLADFAYEEFAQPHIRRLNELHHDAIEGLIAAELDAGHVTEASQRAETLVGEEPLRERGVELLMSALYRSGRHVQALRTYQRHRNLLADDVGVVPSPRLQRLNERILLHDPTLLVSHPQVSTIRQPARNPYKGLRPFGEDDAGDFFGRDALVGTMLDQLHSGRRLLAIVGPSGCGKSSVVAAGLIPRLRAGAVPGSERWLVASLVPGPHPLEETEAVIAREAVRTGPRGPLVSDGEPPWSLQRVPQHDHVLLVIDQFEELFMAADESSQGRYLGLLAAAVTEPAGRLTVALTLRADHYDRPLLHAQFAPVFTAGVLNLLPMTASEINAAVVGPAHAAGATVEPELVAEIVADTVDQPGSLPLLQYALAEQFDRTAGGTLSLDDYNALGGVRAALTRRAEQLYKSLGADQQQVATQVLLRMVRVGHGVGDVSRRVPVPELAQLDVDPVSLSDVLEKFIRYRLLSVGSDPVTSGATVGMAHEALLGEWNRLSAWVEHHRLALRLYDGLRAAATAWEESGRHADYLLTGTRLHEARTWSTATAIRLSVSERDFIHASVARHQADVEAETVRSEKQRRLERRARWRLVGLAAAVVVVIALSIIGIAGLDDPDSPRVTLFYNDAGEVSDLVEAGFDRAVSDHGFISQEVDVVDPGDDTLLDKVATDQQVVIDWTLETNVDSVARVHPETRFIVLDQVATAPNVTSIAFAVNEGSYLAGAAAALSSKTGVIGFIGGVDMDAIWQFEAGFAAGARAIDPNIRIVTTYLANPPDYAEGFLAPAAGERAATQMYRAGADVIFAAAGTSGLGVFEAAVDLSEPGRHLWAIGVDSDQYVTVGDLPGTVASDAWRQHILTSMVKRYDTAVYEAFAAYAEDGTTESVVLGLADHGIDLSYSGGFLDDVRDQIEALRDDIVSGAVQVPCRPSNRQDIDTDETSICRY